MIHQLITGRLTAYRKSSILAEINSGAISEAMACQLYDISPQELNEWQKRHALGDMRVSKRIA